jgi:hypothetical protein
MSEQIAPLPNESENKDFIVLKFSSFITDDMIRHPEWKWLKPSYKKVNTAVGKSLCSIYNSIFYQRRIVFCLTRAATGNLVYYDQNHKKKSSFHNKHYPVIIAKLINEGIVKMLYKGKGKRPAIYEVIHPFFLRCLNGKSKEDQLDETLAFVEKIALSEEPHSEPHSEPRRKEGQKLGTREIKK